MRKSFVPKSSFFPLINIQKFVVKETKIMAKVYFLLFLISFNVVLAKYSKEDSEEDSKEFNEDKEFKCPEPNGMFPHPDCTKFYLCVSDKPIVMDCPAGLHWNDKTKSCDWPQNVGCLSTDKPNQSTTTPKPEMTTITEKTTTDETIIDETTTYETTTETEDMMNETELNTETTTFSPNFTCPTEDGLFAHDDCWMYWECANGIAYERECADGTAWDDLMKICDWPANIISNVKCYIPGKTYI